MVLEMNGRRRAKLRTAARWPVRYTAVFLAIASCNITPWRQAQADHSDESRKWMEKNLKLVANPDGSKTLFVRWAVGTRDHVETLRIPAAYVDPITFFGCVNVAGQPTEECSLPYAVELNLSVKLPDFAPLTQRPQTEIEDRPTLSIFVQSVLWGTKNLTVSESQAIDARISSEMINFGDKKKYRIIEKPEKFGLRRIGLDHRESADVATSFREIYFNGESPETSSDFAVCSDEAVPTRVEDPLSPGVPICEQYFTAPAISATIKVRYERQHLEDWESIKTRLLGLIASFKD